jgi:hypothetical protein
MNAGPPRLSSGVAGLFYMDFALGNHVAALN